MCVCGGRGRKAPLEKTNEKEGRGSLSHSKRGQDRKISKNEISEIKKNQLQPRIMFLKWVSQLTMQRVESSLSRIDI